MTIEEVIDFLEGIRKTDGNIKMEFITGFWVRTLPTSGMRVVIPVTGDGKSLDEFLEIRRANHATR